MVPPDETAEPATQPGVILERGQTIDRFVILGLLGRGGMGEVYAAYDPELDRKIAIKVLRARGAMGADTVDARTRLLREAQAIAKLSHPNVVVVFDVGTLGEGIFLAMEFVDGHTLGFWVHAEPRSWRETLAMFLGAGRGLAAAHAAGIVHRDFKPDNVMVSKDGQVRVMDFGLARQIDGDANAAAPGPLPLSPEALEQRRQVIGEAFDPSLDPDSTARLDLDREDPTARLSPSGRYLALKLTQTGSLLGTPAYMAPEQFAAMPGDARADQFSFCVALYEALYGKRPFAGDNLVNLMTNVTTGAVRDPPARTRVPGWIRKVLLRGLATKPDARYPSMNALLAALQTDPTVRARRMTAGVAALLCVGAIALGARRVAGSHEAPCQGGAQLLAGIWEAGTAPSARKDAIHHAFAATGKSYAELAFSGAGRFLSAYADRWLGMHRDTCVATHVRGEQSAEVLDLRMSCLHERLTSLRALTDVFAAADGTVVENAVTAAGALPALDRCADVALLKAVVKPPEDEPTRRRVETLRRDLARMGAQGDAGHCAHAHQMAEVLLPEVRKIAYPPLLAETLNATGHLADAGCEDESVGLARVREAYSVALASRHDEAAAEAAAHVAGLLVGNMVFDPAAAREWVAISRAMNTRIGGKPVFECWLLGVEAAILRRQGQWAESIAAAEKFRNLMIQTLGKDHPDVFNAFNGPGLCFEAAGRYEEARAEFVAGREMVEKNLGPEHPKVAMAINNEAEVLNLLHRHAEARAGFQRALDIWRHTGSDPFYMAYELTGLGIATLGEGRPADAVPPLEEALRIRTERRVAPEQMGEVRFALARALWASPAARERARGLAKQALADYAEVKHPEGPIPDVAAWLRSPSARL